ncbi:hypothetical protein [Selenomonas sp.]|uniref:hypothetical protein n=1 Tax=Selenomonas sp. TaxID=2053611 RepID=UPI0025E76EBF|nr:hypothetical protein [Selenomonas sp.]MCI6086238.1 hypothetical protein [Selenomonas sp.]MDY3298641.1 hypothetical protein [Selenomonas sp.]MDY4416201.1 hypothetical protein [Selenomonas sp.]
MKIILDEADITSAPELFANLIRELAKPQKEAPAQKERPTAKPKAPTVDRAAVLKLGEKLVEDGKGAKLKEILVDGYGAHSYSSLTDEQLAEAYERMKEADKEEQS